MKPTHIAYLAPGSSIHTVRWVNEMASRGYKVSLLTGHLPLEKLHEGISVYDLKIRGLLDYFLQASAVRRCLEKIKPDLLHAHYASGYGTLARRSGFHPLVMSVWGSDVYDFPLKSPLHRYLVRKNLLAADRVCSTSAVMAKQTKMVAPELDEVHVTPFGVDLERFSPRSHGESNALTIGIVKVLAPKYGIDVLIRAFAKVYQQLLSENAKEKGSVKLLIVGEGPQRSELEQLARQNLPEGTYEFRGRVPYHEVPAALAQLDVYVAPSQLDSESFGVAIIEASACQVPVVVSRVGGLVEVVEEGKTGFILDKRDIDGFARRILELAKSADLRQSMGRTGRQRVKELYEWRKNADEMERIYALASA